MPARPLSSIRVLRQAPGRRTDTGCADCSPRAETSGGVLASGRHAFCSRVTFLGRMADLWRRSTYLRGVTTGGVRQRLAGSNSFGKGIADISGITVAVRFAGVSVPCGERRWRPRDHANNENQQHKTNDPDPSHSRALLNARCRHAACRPRFPHRQKVT